MKGIKRFCAVLVGIVFLIAGLLKLMDPVGAGLVTGEYFNFLHLSVLMTASRFVAIALALLESLVGAALISGVLPLATGILSLLMLLVFAALTCVMWIMNPEMDCGCFGEAVHLNHFQSFVKNLVLLALWGVAFVPMRSVQKPRKVKYVAFSIAAISVVAFTVYSMMSIPAMDFTPFKPGAVLMQAESEPEPDAPLLSICDQDGEYCDELLASGNLLLLTVYDPDSVNGQVTERVAECASAAVDAGVRPVMISAGEFPGAPLYYTSDRRTLMTVNRSNGGATLLADGMLVAKWPFRSLPGSGELSELLTMDAAEAMQKENTPKRLKLQGFLLYVFAVLLLL